MASDKDASCLNDPNFGVICLFLEKFGNSLKIDHPDFKDLQAMIENTDEVSDELKTLMVRLLRKTRKTVNMEKWEQALAKFCYTYSAQDAWEIERFGYKKASLPVKLRVLKEILEFQFVGNNAFKTFVNLLQANQLRGQPFGRDKLGNTYWGTLDNRLNLRVYQEHLDEEIWKTVATNRDELVKLITCLRTNELVMPSSVSVVDEDSSSNSMPPKIDALQQEQPPPPLPPPPVTADPPIEPIRFKLPIGDGAIVEPVGETTAVKKKIDEKSITDEGGSEEEEDSNISEIDESSQAASEISSGNAELKLNDIQSKRPSLLASKPPSNKITSPTKSPDKQPTEVTNQKRPIVDADPIDENTIKIPKIQRPTLMKPQQIKTNKYANLQHKPVQPTDPGQSDDEEDEEEEEEEDEEEEEEEEEEEGEEEEDETDDEVGSEIEEPVLIVKGSGTGADNQSYSFLNDINLPSSTAPDVIVSEAIEEPVMFFYGIGAGVECDVGNPNEKAPETTMFFFGQAGCLKLSPVKNPPTDETGKLSTEIIEPENNGKDTVDNQNPSETQSEDKQNEPSTEPIKLNETAECALPLDIPLTPLPVKPVENQINAPDCSTASSEPAVKPSDKPSNEIDLSVRQNSQPADDSSIDSVKIKSNPPAPPLKKRFFQEKIDKTVDEPTEPSEKSPVKSDTNDNLNNSPILRSKLDAGKQEIALNLTTNQKPTECGRKSEPETILNLSTVKRIDSELVESKSIDKVEEVKVPPIVGGSQTTNDPKPTEKSESIVGSRQSEQKTIGLRELLIGKIKKPTELDSVIGNKSKSGSNPEKINDSLQINEKPVESSIKEPKPIEKSDSLTSETKIISQEPKVDLIESQNELKSPEKSNPKPLVEESLPVDSISIETINKPENLPSKLIIEGETKESKEQLVVETNINASKPIVEAESKPVPLEPLPVEKPIQLGPSTATTSKKSNITERIPMKQIDSIPPIVSEPIKSIPTVSKSPGDVKIIRSPITVMRKPKMGQSQPADAQKSIPNSINESRTPPAPSKLIFGDVRQQLAQQLKEASVAAALKSKLDNKTPPRDQKPINKPKSEEKINLKPKGDEGKSPKEQKNSEVDEVKIEKTEESMKKPSLPDSNVKPAVTTIFSKSKIVEPKSPPIPKIVKPEKELKVNKISDSMIKTKLTENRNLPTPKLKVEETITPTDLKKINKTVDPIVSKSKSNETGEKPEPESTETPVPVPVKPKSLKLVDLKQLKEPVKSKQPEKLPINRKRQLNKRQSSISSESEIDSTSEESDVGGKRPKLRTKQPIVRKQPESVRSLKHNRTDTSTDDEPILPKKSMSKVKGSPPPSAKKRNQTEDGDIEDVIPLSVIKPTDPLSLDNSKDPEDEPISKPKLKPKPIAKLPPPTKTSPQKRRRKLMGLDLNEIENLSAIDADTPVRQSRRIAQIKIKEEAERRKMEEVALKMMKEESEKKKKQIDGDFQPSKSDHSDEEEDSEADGRRKGKKAGKKSGVQKPGSKDRPWQTGSESESSEHEDEDGLDYRYESDRERVMILKSDHEFSPESDLDDETAVPLKRARTVRKESTEPQDVDPDDKCQKCGKHDHPEWILLCDKCDKGWHCSCLIPVLFVIPEGDWYCPPCEQEQLIERLELKLSEYDRLITEKEQERIRLEIVEQERLTQQLLTREKSSSRSPSPVIEKPSKTRTERRRLKQSLSSEPSDDGSNSGSNSQSNDSDDEPIYKLRKRRQIAPTYRFNEFDDLIDSAIKKDMDEAAGAGNLGRGKDISTIIEADKEEKRIKKFAEDQEERDKQQPDEEVDETEKVAVTEEDVVKDEVTVDTEPKEKSDCDSEPIRPKMIKRPPMKGQPRKRRSRKLNSLDISSEDDGSDDDFKTSSLSDDDEEEDEEDDDSDSSLDSFRNKRSKGRQTRRSGRQRRRRFDADFINDNSDDEDVDIPKTKKKKRDESDFSDFNDHETSDEQEEDVDSEDLCDSTDSDDSDRPWNRSKRKGKRAQTKKIHVQLGAKKKTKRKPDEEKAFSIGIPKGKRTDDQPEENGSDDDSMSKQRRTRGRKLTYLLDDFESSDDGIKPSVRRPDTPPEERAAFIKKQEEIKRMLAEKNIEAAKALAAPTIKPVSAVGKKNQQPPDALSTIPAQIIQSAKALDIDLKRSKCDPDSDGFDDDLPDDFDPEDMDEEEIAKMMEEEDFAQQQLKLAGEAIRIKKLKEGNKIRKESEAVPLVPTLPPDLNLEKLKRPVAEPKKRGKKTKSEMEPIKTPPMVPPIQIQPPRLIRPPMIGGPPMNRLPIGINRPHLPPPTITGQPIVNPSPNVSVIQTHSSMQRMIRPPQITHPQTTSQPSLLSGTDSIIPTTVLAVQHTQLLDPSELGPPKVVQQQPLQQTGIPVVGGDDPPVKKRGRRKKYTPLRETLMHGSHPVGIDGKLLATGPGAGPGPGPGQIDRLAMQAADRRNLSVAAPPQLYTPPGNAMPSVITRLPRPQLGPPYGPAMGSPQRFYPGQPGHQPSHHKPPYPNAMHGPPPPLTSGQSAMPSGGGHYVQSNLHHRPSGSVIYRHPGPPNLYGSGPPFAAGPPPPMHRNLQPIAPPSGSPQDYSTSPYSSAYGNYYGNHPPPAAHPSGPPTVRAPLVPVSSSFEQFDNSKASPPPIDRQSPNPYRAAVPPETEQRRETSEFSGLVSYFSSQQDDLET